MWITVRERLSAGLGERGLRWLMREFGGRTLRVPSLLRENRAKRNARIIAALRHRSYAAVARREHLSPRQVIRIGKLPGDLVKLGEHRSNSRS